MSETETYDDQEYYDSRAKWRRAHGYHARACSQTYSSRHRLAGQACQHLATEVIVPLSPFRPFLACGYHARAYDQRTRYVLGSIEDE